MIRHLEKGNCRPVHKKKTIMESMELKNKKENFDLLESLIGFSRWLKRSLTHFFLWIGRSVVWVFNMQIRYFFIFLVLLIGFGIWSYLGIGDEASRTEYVGSAYVSCNGFDNFVLDQSIVKLDKAIKTGNTAFLVSNLSLSAAECRMVKGVRMGVGFDSDDDGIPNQVRFDNKFIADEYTKGEILNKKKEGQVMEKQPKMKKISEQAIIEIRTVLVTQDTFSMLASAVVQYLNKNAELQRMYKVYREGMGYLLQSYQTQIGVLDSLQGIEYFENSRKQKVAQGRDLYMTAMLTSSRDLTVEDVERLTGPNTFYHEDILKLVEEKNKIQSQYELATAPVTMLSDFVPIKEVKGKIWFLWPLCMSVIVTSAVGGLWDYRRQVASYIKQQRAR